MIYYSKSYDMPLYIIDMLPEPASVVYYVMLTGSRNILQHHTICYANRLISLLVHVV